MDVKGEVTAKGSIAHGGPAREDAEIVKRLRDDGAVIVGKTNVPELMAMAFTETVWYGATRNPWDLDRTPGGSSGGSAAAVAAGLVGGATASDGAGSIRIPAACTGLVGLKCGTGVIPTPPSWNGLSTFGFLSRKTADAALLNRIEPAPRRPLRITWSIKPPDGRARRPRRGHRRRHRPDAHRAARPRAHRHAQGPRAGAPPACGSSPATCAASPTTPRPSRTLSASTAARGDWPAWAGSRPASRAP